VDRRIHLELQQVLIILVLSGIAFDLAVWALLRSQDVEGLILNLATEFAGAAVTYILIEMILGRTQQIARERREAEEEKTRLIEELGSSVNHIAKSAADTLRRRGWLVDGSLQKVDLHIADLSTADLSRADLRRANLLRANLQGADLSEANLQGADLRLTDLQGSCLARAILDKYTRLPNGSGWTQRHDLARFTDPHHPNFWRSDDPLSPAYQGTGEPD
jgi:hypothetical protein